MRRLLGSLLIALWAVTGCGGSDGPTTPATINVVGSYTLKSVNGAILPAVVAQSGTTKVEILDDLFTLNADHTYSEVGHLRTTSGASVTTTAAADVGVYTATNGAISLTTTVAGNSNSTASLNGTTLTVLDGGATLVYQKN